MTSEDMVKRTTNLFYDQTPFSHFPNRPDHQATMSLSEMRRSVSTDPMIIDSNGYQDQLKQFMAQQACLPLQGQSRSLHHLLKAEEDLGMHSRAKRQFVPMNKKDGSYWLKRCKNNDSARRSRFKRKCLDKILEQKLAVLQNENCRLKYELKMLKQNSKHISTHAFATNAGESTSFNNTFGTLSYYHNEANLQSRSFTGPIKREISIHSSGDENDSSHSSYNYDSGEYPLSNSSSSYTSDQDALKSMCSIQSADGGSSSDTIVCMPDLPQDDKRTTYGAYEEISSLKYIEKVLKVPHKLRMKNSMHSIVESSSVSEDISERESRLI